MTIHEQWLEKIKQFPKHLQLPPPTLHELGIEYLEIIPDEKMVAKVPFQKRFTNPVGVYQGGMLSACIDEVFGPLSYLSAQAPCITLNLNTMFLGTFKEEMKFCIITAIMLKKTKNFMFMRAEVHSNDGELLAHAETQIKIL